MQAASRAAAALIFCGVLLQNGLAFPAASLMEQELDGEETRKVLGSSVVTSVSVILDLGNGSQAFADATGRPVEKPESAAHLASPPSLMSPDRYEFYTFNDAGDLVKRLMTMDEIQGLIAGESVEIGSDLPGIEPDEVEQPEERPGSFFFLPHPLERTPDWSPPGVDKVVKRVQDVLADVQNRITIEEGNHVPSWGINRPDAQNSPLHPTQNIPGSILHLLKDTPEKFSTFVPPVQSFNPLKPDSETNINEGTSEDSTVGPSSTPILPPVSSTIQISSTTAKVEVTSTESPVTENSKTTEMPILKTTTSVPVKENFVPVVQINSDSQSPPITIPSTIIADLLIEDMHEKIKHTEPPKTTFKPIVVQEKSTTPLNIERETTTTTTNAPETKSTTLKTTTLTTPIPVSLKSSTVSSKPVLVEKITTPTYSKISTISPNQATASVNQIQNTTSYIKTTQPSSTTLKVPTNPTTSAPKSPPTTTQSTTTSTQPPISTTQKATTTSAINLLRTTLSTTKPPIEQNYRPTTGFYITKKPTTTVALEVTTRKPQKENASFVLITESLKTAPQQNKSSVIASSTNATNIKLPSPTPVVKNNTYNNELQSQNVETSTYGSSPVYVEITQKTTIPPATTVKITSKPTLSTTTTANERATTVKPKTTIKPTAPPLEDLQAQVHQIAQSLTDKKASSVRPIPITNAALSTSYLFSASTASFGSSLQTGKTTPKTTAATTIAPTTEKTTTIKYIPVEMTTDSVIYETQMTTVNEPPAADNLILEDITSKTSDFELTPESVPTESDGLSEYDFESEDIDSFESTERTETSDDVPFISQIFEDASNLQDEETATQPTTIIPQLTSTVKVSSTVASTLTQGTTQALKKGTTEEKLPVNMIKLKEASTEKPALTLKTTQAPKKTTPVEKPQANTNKSTDPSTSKPIKVSTTESIPTSTTRIQPQLKTTSRPVIKEPVAQVKNVSAAIKAPEQSTQKPDIKQEVNTQSSLNAIESGAGQSATSKQTYTQNTKTNYVTVTSPTVTKTTNVMQDDFYNTDSDEDMELVSTTEYIVHPSTIKHASTVKLDTKGPTTVPSNLKPMVTKLDREKIKEVLDQILDTAGILNLGDSSEEAVREEIYTTFIPASTTAINTSPQPSNSKNATVVGTSLNKTESHINISTSAVPVKNNTVQSQTENITDLEVSWQEPPEVVWTNEKPTKTTEKAGNKYTASSTQKMPTSSKITTTAPTTVVSISTTTESVNTNAVKDVVYTKSNDDGMELIATSDQMKPSTPSIRTPPKTYIDSASPDIVLTTASINNLGLEATTVMLDEDVRRFIDLSNDIGIRLYKHTTSDLDKRRSIAISPFGATSLIGMVFIGARGQTSAQINDFLPFDDMITFNPHLVMRNITDSVIMSPDLLSAAIVRELYSQKGSKQPLDFYKARASAFYDGLVQQVDFDEISKVVRERTNELVKTQTSSKVPMFLGDAAILRLNPPFAALSANVFQMNCALATSTGRDGEMNFHGEKNQQILPATVWSGEFMYGYDVGLDATAVEIPHSNSAAGAETSTVFVMPGKPGFSNGGVPLLARLEARLISRRAWSGLLRNLQRTEHAIDVQVPRFEHRSVLNLTVPLSRMGLKDLFSERTADLRGVNGIQELYLSDITQMNVFSLCSTPDAEGHVETYPSSKRTGRLGSRGGEDEEDDYDWRSSTVLKMPLPLRPRQARIPMSDNPRLKIDRPFMYFVRHNPTGMILHIGRFNPRDEP